MPNLTMSHFSLPRLNKVKMPEVRSSRPQGRGTFLRLAQPAFARGAPSHTPRMAAAPSGVTSRIHERKGGRREKAKGFCFGVPHFKEFSWRPSSAYISFAGCTAAVRGTYSFLTLPPRKHINPKHPT